VAAAAAAVVVALPPGATLGDGVLPHPTSLHLPPPPTTTTSSGASHAVDHVAGAQAHVADLADVGETDGHAGPRSAVRHGAHQLPPGGGAGGGGGGAGGGGEG